ncbi:G-type lectin S-receptor-like serine/threonine-protein kinase RLK1 [Pyrus ussuriensis x Pyrus communis]|uniref:Receptor-like serine/threonine-protein kinase n=1 Tax=Pyrus ussuriensis x Pyrus communis TaxID=2448454 RepID=A0A5N5FR65_9ROSA|nr:G-type lectin S-receptor-like serine/threonine-protein kinase RLK1 [Pyrus ussuriensis x Pyrus communis]
MDFELPYPFFFLLLLLVLLPFSNTAQTYNNISLGSSLTALDDYSSSWPSPSGEFAFGFRQPGVDGFLLAIWFNKIQERTIVWSANAGSLVPQGSQVELTNDGQFMLKDKTGKQIYFAGSWGITGVAYAAMLDTGNFVLANKSSKYLWESFEEPTNTLLPTQTLKRNSKLYASYTASNYTPGRFRFALKSDGGLLLYTTNYPLDSANCEYWSTHTEGSGFQVIFSQSGSIYLTGTNGSILYMISDNTYSTQDFYHRAMLEYNGVFRHYVYPKKTGLGSVGTRRQGWSSSSFIPPNLCASIAETTGSGACGFNSLCREGTEGPVCECPDGYGFIDENDVLKGCKQKFVSQSCDEAFPETHLFDLQELENGDWPFSDYQHFQPVSEDWCKQSCLSDCSCAVVIFKNGDCWKKGIPLINGRIDPTVGNKALVKIRNNSTNSIPNLARLGLLGSSAFLNLLLLIITCLLFFHIIHHRKAKLSMLYLGGQGNNLKSFTYMEMKGATNGFKEELGRGAFATVFKGVLASEDGKPVAVKRLDTMVRENDLEFKAEVTAIGRTNHKNLVQLLGFCNEGQHRILVYEFMSNGSLASFLFGESRPSWYQRREIALGTARGILYLHEECSIQILHCDIKPQNILLDDSFNARIADFGVAKLLKIEQTRTTTRFRGTRGYVAPEWFKSLPVTVKADVYSFGILLLEIVCCRKNYIAKMEDEDQMILADWAYHCYEQNKLHQLFRNDDDEAKDDIEEMKAYLMIAFWCIQEDASPRPTMRNVTQMLEGTVELSNPPNPSSLYVQCKGL